MSPRTPAAGGDRLHLTVTGDPDHVARLPLTPMDARIVVAAPRRAADRVRGRGE